MQLVGDSFSGQGASSTSNNLLLNVNNIKLSAGTNHGSSDSSSKTNTQSVSGTSAGGLSANVSGSKTSSQQTSTTYTNSEFITGNVQGDLDSLTLNGAIIKADSGNLHADELSITTAQNMASGTNNSSSLGFGVSGGAGDVSGGSANFGSGRGSNDSQQSAEQSAIVFNDATGNNHSLTAGNTNITGAVIANVSQNADVSKEKGEHCSSLAQGEGCARDVSNNPLNFTTNTLTTADLQDYSNNDQSGFNVAVTGNVHASTAQKDTQVIGGTTTLGANNSGHAYEATTLTTIGTGAVVTSDPSALDGVNTDINTATVVTRDQATGGLNATVTVDNRVFTEEGRAEIAGELDDLGVNSKQAGLNVGEAVSDGIAVAVEAVVDDPQKAAEIATAIETNLGSLSLGLIPTTTNYGGLLTQLPVLFVGDMEKLGDLSSNNVFINGIMNSLSKAFGAGDAIIGSDPTKQTWYNPTHGIVGDLLESLVDKLPFLNTGNSNQVNTWLGEGRSAGINYNLYLHSQGHLIALQGLQNGNIDPNNVFSFGAPVHVSTLLNLGIPQGNIEMNGRDHVSNFVGGNFSNYKDSPNSLGHGAVNYGASRTGETNEVTK